MKCICDTCRYEPKSCIDRCQLESEKYAEKEVIKFAKWVTDTYCGVPYFEMLMEEYAKWQKEKSK